MFCMLLLIDTGSLNISTRNKYRIVQLNYCKINSISLVYLCAKKEHVTTNIILNYKFEIYFKVKTITKGYTHFQYNQEPILKIYEPDLHFQFYNQRTTNNGNRHSTNA